MDRLASDRPTILVVEDDFISRMAVIHQLEEAGFKVLAAADADEAFAIANQVRRFDVLFTDVRLPGPLDGLELATRLSQESRCGAVIYATGYSYDPPRMVSPSIIFRKPYSFNAITGAAKRMVDVARIGRGAPASCAAA